VKYDLNTLKNNS